jgi:hypothetical protein
MPIEERPAANLEQDFGRPSAAPSRRPTPAARMIAEVF